MKRLVLFSSPKGKNFVEILDKIFPKEIENKVFAYIPTHKKYLDQEFTNKWMDIANKYNAEFRYIDLLSGNKVKIRERVLGSNIIVMTGGNTFWLLDKLRKTGIFDVIKEIFKKDNFVIAGWSAGALVMTPSIAMAGIPQRIGGKTPFDENKVGLTDLTGLNFVNFEIFPHFDISIHRSTFEEYKKRRNGNVKALTDDEYIIIDL